jgi:RsiW-degrading membrane proteinase PrsW (M82 family)
MGYLINYLIEQVSWQNFLFFILLSTGPTLLWLILCLKADKSSPEPSKEILKVFVFGIFIAILIIPIAGYLTRLAKNNLLSQSLLSIFILSFFIDGLIEELAKYFVLRFKIYYSKYFDELRDGFIYGMVLGLGFSFIENILYAFLSNNFIAGAGMIISRGFTSTFMHFLSGGIIGYHIALFKMKQHDQLGKEGRKQKWIMIRGLLIAVLFHGFYNSIIRFNWWWNLVPLAILLSVVCCLILKKIKSIS